MTDVSLDEPLMILNRGDSLVAWAVSPVTAVPFPGEPAPAEDRVDYRFVNGFVDVGDLPCRVATHRDVAARTVALQTEWPVEAYVLPGTSRRVEFNQFRHTPTRLSRWCRTQLRPARDGTYAFRLDTRGGVHIWVDGTLAARFEPFTRNQDQHTTVHLPLSAGGSEIVVLMEEMAERDTIWYFELALLDDAPLEVRLPGAERGPHIAMLSRLAAEVRPDGESLSSGPLTLVFDTPAPLPLSVHVRIEPTSHEREVLLDRTVRLDPGQSRLDVCDAAELPDGYHRVVLDLQFERSSVTRVIACAVLHEAEPQQRDPDIAVRKREALDHAARHGELRMGTALAMLATGTTPDARFRQILDNTLTAIEDRQDCADFEMVPLLWVMARYAERLPADIRARAEAAIVGFRYWVDEPGNDVMWFWSENHALCFHVSQLLAGRLFPDSWFAASGRTGAAQAKVALQRLGRWFDAVEEEGLAEWNSAAYYPIDLIGLLALVEFAPDALAARARTVTDRIFTMVALHTLQGVPAGTMGRAYDKELRAGPLTELAPIATVAFGRGWLNRGVAAMPMFAAGSYRPPAEAIRNATPADDEAIEAHYVQGYGRAAALALFRTASVQLSTNVAAKAGGYGHQQHVTDVLFAAHPFARAWINHPGEDDPWGSARPSYWAGNGALPRAGQHGNAALLLYDLGDAPRIPFTHAYVSTAGIETHLLPRAIVMQAGDGLAAFLATEPLEPVTSGPGAGREFRAHGRKVGWAVIVDQGCDVRDFLQQIERTRLALDADRTTLVLRIAGMPERSLNWHDGLRVAGKPWRSPNDAVDPVVTRHAWGHRLSSRPPSNT